MNTPEQTEMLAELVAQVARQDREAFGALYRATSLKLFGIALRILHRRENAENVLQDAYVDIWNQAAHFDASRGTAFAWMCAMIRARALDEARRDPPPVELADRAAAAFENMPSAIAAQDTGYSAAYKKLSATLDELEEPERRAFLLAYHYGFSRDYLAKHFDQKIPAIRGWLRRATQLLAKEPKAPVAEKSAAKKAPRKKKAAAKPEPEQTELLNESQLNKGPAA